DAVAQRPTPQEGHDRLLGELLEVVAVDPPADLDGLVRLVQRQLTQGRDRAPPQGIRGFGRLQHRGGRHARRTSKPWRRHPAAGGIRPRGNGQGPGMTAVVGATPAGPADRGEGAATAACRGRRLSGGWVGRPTSPVVPPRAPVPAGQGGWTAYDFSMLSRPPP